MTKHLTFRSYISASCKKFRNDQVGKNGWSLYLRATAAKLIWIVLLVQIGNYISPLSSHVFSSVAVLAFLAGANWVWDQLLKDRIPDFIDQVATGDIAYELDMSPLNTYIATVSVANFLVFLLPIIFAVKDPQTTLKEP